MTDNKHTVSTDALATIGNLLDASAGRDAIHLAVEPVIAANALEPGERIGFLPDGRVTGNRGVEILGIVDPFLSENVCVGQRFWMIVLPRTIASLRHVWEHPGFAPSGGKAPDTSASEQWMRAFAVEHFSEDYYGDRGKFSEDEAYAFAIEAGHTNQIGPYEEAREHMQDEWWSHWEIITGEKGDRDSYFSCAC